jgi:3-deoxy-manno-octulosonate cytidylyltransferase (CMP-KDO synthetase)
VKILGVIPARYASTRFPGKPLAKIAGITMIERVFRQSIKAKSLGKLVVATDDERIKEHVTSFGGEAVLTSPDHPSGTDRCYEALVKLGEDFDYVINIQGDEPFIDPEQINILAGMLQNRTTELATLMMIIKRIEVLFNDTTVKIVVNHRNEALYFSRQPIPFLRGINSREWLKHFTYYSHIGMYAYRSDILYQVTRLAPSSLEKAEMLEQLRWLENGFTIRCGITDIESYSVDTPEDIERVLALRNFV